MNKPVMTKESAVQILNSRKLISKEGKFTVKVTSAAPFLRENNDGSKTPVTIVNFAAMTQYQLSQAQELFKTGDYQGATNLNMSASQLSGQFVPLKGEIVDVEVGTIQNKEGINILVVTSIVARQAEKAGTISFSLEEDAVETATKAEAVLV